MENKIYIYTSELAKKKAIKNSQVKYVMSKKAHIALSVVLLKMDES